MDYGKKAYNKITKKELYKFYVEQEIRELQADMVAHKYTTATMYHAHMGGHIPAKYNHLVRGPTGGGFIPNLRELHDKYGDMPQIADDYRKQLEIIVERIAELKGE